ncbi:MAG: bacteriophage holin [Haloarculaceae archaeon]
MDTESAGLDVRAFGLACALLWSGAVVVLGLTARVGWGRRWQRLLADVYRGYDESGTGLLAGAAWAFADGFAGGYAFAWLYDRLRR